MKPSICIFVSRPIEIVFAWITQPEHVVHWIQSRQDVIAGEAVQSWRISAGEIQDLSATPLHEGVAFRYAEPGSPSCTIEITEYVPPRTFSFEVFQTGSFLSWPRSRHSMTLQPAGDETKLSYTVTSYPGCLWALIERLTPHSSKILRQRMRELKEHLEAQIL